MRKYEIWIVFLQGELRFSLGVEGEIIDVPRLAIVEPFEAVAFDECGTISISFTKTKNKIQWLNSFLISTYI